MKNLLKLTLCAFTALSFTLVSCETKRTETSQESTTPPVDSDEGAAAIDKATVPPDAAAEANAASGTADSAAAAGTTPTE